MRSVATASPWSPDESRPQSRASKRAAVLRTAAKLFNEKGFHATSLDDVADCLQVSKPTIYYYVESKDEILFGCVHAGLEMVRAGIAEVDRGGGSALERLRACMRAYADVVTQDFGMCVIRVGEDPLPAGRRRELRRLKAQIDAEFRKLIEQGIVEGSIAPCDPKLTAFTLAGALSWIGRWYRADGALPAGQIAEQCIATLLAGIVPRPGPVPARPKKRGAASRSARHP